MRRKIMLWQPRYQKRTLVVPLFIVGLMVLSVLAYTGSNTKSPQEIIYSGYTFTPDTNNKVWKVVVNGQEFAFTVLPKDVAHIPLVGTVGYPRYQWGTINENSTLMVPYISFAKYEASRILAQRGTPVREPLSISYNEQLVIDCRHAQDSDAVIVFEPANATEVVTTDHCIHIRGSSGQDLVLSMDRFLYTILGIMS